jgi:S-methylmethionine-dependent homocysteine/selenocysteine methylase
MVGPPIHHPVHVVLMCCALTGAVLHDGSEYRGDYCAQMSQAELIAFHLPRIEMLLSNPALAPDLFACEV